jgi:glycosyltransferase involved in cell wall biosynthesis
MGILHVENQAGVANQLAQAQRRLGHQAVVMETWYNTLNEPHDVDFYYDHKGLLSDISNGRRIVRFARDFDIVHVHGGIFWKRWDVVAMGLYLRKPMVVHYHGSETRDGYGLHYKFLAGHKFVSRPDLLKWIPTGEYIPNPVGEHEYSFDVTSKPRVFHMSTNRRTKGTDLIQKALEELSKERDDFEYVILDKVDHATAMKELGRSHILIDQVIDSQAVNIPSVIGLATFEAMAMGKVSISTFDQEYQRYYPGCPVIAIEPDLGALKEAIAKGIEDLPTMKKIGLAGRQYVKEHHSADEIVKRVMQVYEEMLG